MTSLDAVGIKTVFERRASVMRSVPHFLRGAFRAAYRVALNETVRGCEEREGTRQIQGWKLSPKGDWKTCFDVLQVVSGSM